jgi:hypothetical protein
MMDNQSLIFGSPHIELDHINPTDGQRILYFFKLEALGERQIIVFILNPLSTRPRENVQGIDNAEGRLIKRHQELSPESGFSIVHLFLHE